MLETAYNLLNVLKLLVLSETDALSSLITHKVVKDVYTDLLPWHWNLPERLMPQPHAVTMRAMPTVGVPDAVRSCPIRDPGLDPLLHEPQQIVLGQGLDACFRTLEEVRGQLALGLVEIQNAFLHAALLNHAVDGDGTLLAYAVCPVRRLVFHGRIPPGVQMNHVVRGRQVDTRAACLQGKQKDVALPALKGSHTLLAHEFRGLAVKVLIRDALFLQSRAYLRKIGRELGEGEHLVTGGNEVLHGLHKALGL